MSKTKSESNNLPIVLLVSISSLLLFWIIATIANSDRKPKKADTTRVKNESSKLAQTIKQDPRELAYRAATLCFKKTQERFLADLEMRQAEEKLKRQVTAGMAAAAEIDFIESKEKFANASSAEESALDALYSYDHDDNYTKDLRDFRSYGDRLVYYVVTHYDSRLHGELMKLIYDLQLEDISRGDYQSFNFE
ncbi:hypothetical protein JIN85_16985 [Luteolibacter pohnpeiensis]|uniref:Uncharacterized protein n=1 Tax=Luteolibacter pohnpeiensis TaxID=454153 RepID=A0A934SFA0_9BACT|nr:hypothetical protein [Luteolibacter pohnpeiensis]MBK1884118.1 hypothetical protein [Luteolibacter pohnpeiensis]